ncbi:MAG: ferritin family protein [Sedimentisphaerales bacterium]|nr:ferritin family protein [Sedimentisphaerales bacterium]
MLKFNTTDEVLDFAIKNEIEAAKFYTDLAGKMDNPEMKKVFKDFADEEKGHRKQLEDIKKGRTFNVSKEKIADLKIADYTVDVEPTSDMDYQAAITLAMKKEKKAFQLYTTLAYLIDDATAQQLFTSLAQQEAKHKLRFELEYDDIVLKDN